MLWFSNSCPWNPGVPTELSEGSPQEVKESTGVERTLLLHGLVKILSDQRIVGGSEKCFPSKVSFLYLECYFIVIKLEYLQMVF